MATHTDQADNVTTNTYDTRGRLIEAITEDTDGHILADDTTTYDNAGNVLTTGEFDRTTETNTYDPDGNLATSTDALGGTTAYLYDNEDRVYAVVPPRGNTDGADPWAYATYTWYDQNGNVVGTQNPDFSFSTTDYDADNRPTTATNADGHTTVTDYTATGQVHTVTDPLGHVTTYTYDNAGRLTEEALPGQDPTNYGYNADGQRTSQTSPSGDSTMSWTYTPDGQVATQVDPTGMIAGATPADHTTSYDYDADGNRTQVTDQLDHNTKWTYDPTGNPLTETDPRGHATTWTYDLQGQLSTVTAPGGATTGYAYNHFGELTTRTDALERETTFEHDANGNLISQTDPLGHQKTWDYDPDGNLISQTAARGHETGVDPADWTTTYTVDPRGQVTATEIPGQGAVTYGYDYTGHLVTMTDDTGSSGYSYDDAGRLTDAATPAGEFAYTYNAAGQITARSYPAGGDITYTYNADGLIDTQTANAHTTTYIYNANQELHQIEYPSATGLAETYDYDATGLVHQITDTQTGNSDPLDQYTYTRNPIGEPTAIERTHGATTTSQGFKYDNHDELTSWCPDTSTCDGTTADRVDYTYNAVGDRLEQDRLGTVPNPGDTTYTYDDADELTTTTTGTTTTSHTYDADGNPTDDDRTWNALNQLTGITLNSQTTTYTYDGLGNRATTTTGAQTTTWAWDTNDTLPMLATVTNADGTHDAFRYTPNGDVLGAEHLDGQPYARDFYTHEDLGSPTNAVNGDGTTTWAWDYSPFGEATTHKLASNAIAPKIGYSGSVTDGPTNQDYLRARTYDPTSGRFTNRDPLAQEPTRPWISDYTYVGNQPTLLTDPTGQCPLGWCPPRPPNPIKVLHHVVDAAAGAFHGATDTFDYAYNCVSYARTATSCIDFLHGGGTRYGDQVSDYYNNQVGAQDNSITFNVTSILNPLLAPLMLACPETRLADIPALADDPALLALVKLLMGRGAAGSGPVAGVLEASATSKSVAAINAWNAKSGVEFVFDAETGTFAMGRPAASAGLKGSPHQQLAEAIGANPNTVVGGIVKRVSDGMLTWNEQSGHFWQNWTPQIRQKFVATLRSYGVNISG